MAYLFETEEDEEAGRGKRGLGRKRRGARDDEEDGAEITLGGRSLLGIFFGLVLICSIFFGLGYSVGRGSAAKTAVAAAGSDNAGSGFDRWSGKAFGATGAGLGARQFRRECGAGGAPEESAPALEPAVAPATEAGPPRWGARRERAFGSDSQAGWDSRARSRGRRIRRLLRPAVATTGANGIMVQVAAISVPQDADILVDALKKRGYTAVIRNEPQDKLLHVQLGPFASRRGGERDADEAAGGWV